MEKYNAFVNNNLGWIHENKYVYPVIVAFLAMYPALIRPKLPSYLEKLFINPVFRLVMISYIIYASNRNIEMAIVGALIFLTTMHVINKRKIDKLAEETKV